MMLVISYYENGTAHVRTHAKHHEPLVVVLLVAAMHAHPSAGGYNRRTPNPSKPAARLQNCGRCLMDKQVRVNHDLFLG